MIMSHRRMSSCGARSAICFDDVVQQADLETPYKPLDGSTEEQKVLPIVSWGVFLGALANCSNTIIGAGSLSIPKVFSMTGLLGYHILAFSVLSITGLSLYMLVAVLDRLPDDVPRNYEGIANHFLGFKWATAISIAFVFGGLSLTMAYMLLTTTSLAPLAAAYGWGDVKTMEEWLLFGIGFGFCLPLALMRDMSGLKLTSSFAVFTMLYAALFVTITGMNYALEEGVAQTVVSLKTSTEAFDALAMSISAYSCHISVMPIYESLGPGRTPAIMMKIIGFSLCSAFLFYEAIGLAGYFQFGSDVSGNVLLNIASVGAGSSQTIGTTLASAGVALKLVFTVPIVIWPVRSCLLFAYQLTRVSRASDGDIDDELLENVDKEPTTNEWNLATVLVMAFVILMSRLCPDVKTSLSVVGSVGGSFMVLIYPPAFYLAVVKESPPADWRMSTFHAPQLAMITAGAAIGILCLYFSLASFF